MTIEIIHLESKHYTAGIIVEDGLVIRYAPRVKWARNKSIEYVMYVARRDDIKITVMEPIVYKNKWVEF